MNYKRRIAPKNNSEGPISPPPKGGGGAGSAPSKSATVKGHVNRQLYLPPKKKQIRGYAPAVYVVYVKHGRIPFVQTGLGFNSKTGLGLLVQIVVVALATSVTTFPFLLNVSAKRLRSTVVCLLMFYTQKYR